MRAPVLALIALSMAACGVVGNPIPPEQVGVGHTIEMQKRQDELEAKKREEAEQQQVIPPPGQDVELPPLQPVGGR